MKLPITPVSKRLGIAVLSAILLIIVGLCYTVFGLSSPLIFVIALLIDCVLIAKSVIDSTHTVKHEDTLEDTSLISGLSMELILKSDTPAIICNGKETVIWVNGAFFTVFGKNKPSGMSFKQFCGKAIGDLLPRNEKDTTICYENRYFDVSCYPFNAKNKKYYLTIWYDQTELINLKKQLEDEDVQVGYVVADNLEDISQYTKESTREAEIAIEKQLSAWISSKEGILREYQSGRYLLILRSSKMKELISEHFPILDTIRSIKVGLSGLSVTLSVGISYMTGSISEKEKVASEALDMALQRGGDQAVVKSTNGLEMFGGRSQAIQRTTKIRSRVFGEDLVKRINESDRVLVFGHRSPDFDCIGGCVGIARLSEFCGVPARIVINRSNPTFRKCYEHIRHIPLYENENIFIGNDEALNMVTPGTLIVVVDVNNISQVQCPEVLEIGNRVAYFDHHRKTAEFDTPPLICNIDPSASSACEMITEVVEQAFPSGIIKKEEADLLYAGILLDTKRFTKNAGIRTFSAALYLRSEGALPQDVLSLFKEDIRDFTSEAKFESNVVIYRNFIAISCNDDENAQPEDRIAAAKAADKLLSVEGVKASFALCRIADKIHISARSVGEINVQLILERLNGGGHFDAAATQVSGEMNQALKMLKSAIDEYLETLRQ